MSGIPSLPFWQPAPLLLASRSPRREELLRLAGFVFRIDALDMDETYPETLPAGDIPAFLAAAKSKASAHLARPGEVMLTADTLVFLDDDVIGKPLHREQAIDMIDRLQGRTHTVITGICLRRDNAIWVGTDRTEVTIEAMNVAEIAWYVDQCKPMDKAGAYGVQEWLGLCRISRLEGSYANVVGLPVHRVYQALRDRVV
ncbi:MAG: septum formation protein Maf [Saprospiraceae bacterium]|nr:septum formation protein Maf [Saprospiraceae bacterium]